MRALCPPNYILRAVGLHIFMIKGKGRAICAALSHYCLAIYDFSVKSKKCNTINHCQKNLNSICSFKNTISVTGNRANMAEAVPTCPMVIGVAVQMVLEENGVNSVRSSRRGYFLCGFSEVSKPVDFHHFLCTLES